MRHRNKNMEEGIISAKRLIQDAQVLIITSGAGMGVDSGLGTFRGRHAQETEWGPYEREEETPYSMAKPRRMNEDPHVIGSPCTHQFGRRRIGPTRRQGTFKYGRY